MEAIDGFVIYWPTIEVTRRVIRYALFRYQYDGDGSDGDQCKITEYNQNRVCNVTFEIDEDMSGPVHVYYELSNFYQNHAT